MTHLTKTEPRSTVSKEQVSEALHKWKLSMLSPTQRWLLNDLTDAESKLAHLLEKIEELRKSCNHPLILRELQDFSCYDHTSCVDVAWTQHTCGLCKARWQTETTWETEQ